MKGYLIDPKNRLVHAVDVSDTDTLQDIYKHVGASCIDCVRMPNDDTIYIDDEGLFRKHDYFTLVGYQSPLAGTGLVLGTDREGNSVDPVQTLEELARQVIFITWEEALAMAEAADERGKEMDGVKDAMGFTHIYVPIAGILKDAAYTDSSK